MVGKDIRKLTQKRKVGKKKGRATKHKSRPSLKACDPFSGRSYKEKSNVEYNLDPEKEELDGYEGDEQDDLNSYSSFKEKPNYRRGSNLFAFSRNFKNLHNVVVFADEINDMKQKKKEEKKQKRLNALMEEVFLFLG